MESGSVQIHSWHFDTRDRELAVGTAARMWNYGSLCSGHQVGDVGVGVGGEGFRRRRCGLQVGWMSGFGSHCWPSW